MELFEINGLFVEIQQNKYEPREVYLRRVWYILNKIKQNKNCINSFQKLVQESRIESNEYYLKCSY